MLCVCVCVCLFDTKQYDMHKMWDIFVLVLFKNNIIKCNMYVRVSYDMHMRIIISYVYDMIRMILRAHMYIYMHESAELRVNVKISTAVSVLS